MVETVGVVVPRTSRSYVEWAPIIAGAFCAAAVSVLLLAFGSSVGLTAISPWPNSGLPWWLLALIAALWFLFVQVGSYAAGGYLAGRLRAPLDDATQHEVQFRDGAHGFLVWALGVVVTVAIIGSTAGSILRTGAEAGATVAAGSLAAGAEVASSVLPLEDDPVGYALDRLMRSTPSAQEGSEANTPRSEASRIFAGSLEGGTLNPDDRAYLTEVVSARAALSPEAANERVDEAFAAVQEAQVQAREAADEARRSAVITGFLATAALLISAAAAALAAGLGGTHRDSPRRVRFLGSERFW